MRKHFIFSIALGPKIKHGSRAIAIAIALSSASVIAQAPTDTRVALVIGNSAYAGKMALKNPINDAQAMAASLRNLGFTVIEAKDASRAQMEDAIQKMFGALKGKQGIGMLYYAGHGLQVDWKNFMVPVDAKLQTAKDVPAQTVDVGDVIDALKAAGSRMNIVVLDACRDNPFAGNSGKGLAPVDAPPGTFLAYATAPGNVAEDGTGDNGLYTKHLLTELQKPVSIENVFKRVRFAVRKESNGRQIPWESTSLEDDFSFAANKQVASVSHGAQREADFAEQKAEWDKIKTSTNAEDVYRFLERFPSGLIAEIAQSQLEKMKGSVAVAQSAKGEKAQAPNAPRVVVGDKWTIRTKERSKGFFGYSDNEYSMDHTVVKQTGDVFEVQGKGVVKSFYTSRGAVVRYEAGIFGPPREFDPPLPRMPQGIFKIGDKSVSRSAVLRSGEKLGEYDAEIKVLTRETLSTPMGSFDTYKIERNSTELDVAGRLVQANWTAWYIPDLIVPIKETVQVPAHNYTATHELVNLVRANR